MQAPRCVWRILELLYRLYILLVDFHNLIFYVFEIILDAVIDHHAFRLSVIWLFLWLLNRLLKLLFFTLQIVLYILYVLHILHLKYKFLLLTLAHLRWVLVIHSSSSLIEQHQLLLKLSVILTCLHFPLTRLIIRCFGLIWWFWIIPGIILTFNRLIWAAFVRFKHIPQIYVLIFQFTHLILAHIAWNTWIWVHNIEIS